MAYTDLVAKAQTYFPNLQIKYKDQSTLMKIAGKLLFFNPGFMTSYLTTLGDTVYLPSEQYAAQNPQAFTEVFIHECTHMYDEKKAWPLVYAGLYLPADTQCDMFVTNVPGDLEDYAAANTTHVDAIACSMESLL